MQAPAPSLAVWRPFEQDELYPRMHRPGKGVYPRDFVFLWRDLRIIHTPSTPTAMVPGVRRVADRPNAPETTKHPKEPRSLDAPTHVNTGQITRCSWPLRARPTLPAGGPSGNRVIHEFPCRCLAF